MGSASGLLLLLLPVAVLTDTNYKEGARVNGDVNLCDCTYDIIGTVGARFHETFTYTSSTPRTSITYIEATNLKDQWPANITKLNPGGGGVSQLWITFKMDNQKNHGAKFQFKVYGTLPQGAYESPLTGDCLVSNKGKKN